MKTGITIDLSRPDPKCELWVAEIDKPMIIFGEGPTPGRALADFWKQFSQKSKACRKMEARKLNKHGRQVALEFERLAKAGLK